jgi:hypothetical protein
MQNYIITHFVKAAFTVDGDTTGVGIITVSTTDAPLLWPGARVIVDSSTQDGVEALILEDLGGGKFRVRLDDTAVGPYAIGGPVAVPTPKAGSTWAAYTVADAAFILQPQDQMIFNYTREGIVPRVPSALQGQ